MSINNLPSEILLGIFELAVGELEESGNVHSYPKAISPQTLSSVCCLWQDMVLRNPLLWNNIQLGTSDDAILQTRLHLDRSASSPLDIQMKLKEREWTLEGIRKFKRYGKIFLDFIEDDSHRWRTLEIRMPTTDFKLGMKARPIWNGRAPILEKLVLSCGVPPRGAQRLRLMAKSPSPTLLTGSDKLTSLTISGFAVRWDQWNCKSVTHLSLGPFTPINPGPKLGEFCSILSIQANKLLFLRMTGPWEVLRDETVFQGPIALKALTSLAIFEWESMTEDILLRCNFPVLGCLEMSVPFTLPTQNTASLFCDEPRPFQSVKCLTVRILGETPASVLEILRRGFAQVEHIQLSNLSPLDSVASAFVASWAPLIRLDIPEAGLLDVKELLLRRKQTYPTPLQELNLWIAQGLLFRGNYEWVLSHVDRFTISQVRPQLDKTSPSDLWRFEDKYVIGSKVVQK